MDHFGDLEFVNLLLEKGLENKKSHIILLLCLLFVKPVFGQDDDFNKNSEVLFNQIRIFDLAVVDTSFFSKKSPKTAFLQSTFYRLKEGKYYDLKINDEVEGLDLEQRFFKLLLKGDVTIEENKNMKSDSIAYTYYLKAYNIAMENNKAILICEALKKILKYQFKAKEDVLAFHEFAKIYRDLAYDLHEELYSEYYYFGSSIGILYDFKRRDLEPLPDALKALNVAENHSKYYLAGRLSQLIGVYYDIIVNDKKNARSYYRKSILYYQRIPYYYAQKNRNDLSYNLGSLELESGNYLLALDYLNNVNLSGIPKRDSQDKVLIFANFYEAYLGLQQIDSAIYYLQKKSDLQDSLDLII